MLFSDHTGYTAFRKEANAFIACAGKRSEISGTLGR